MEIEAKRVGAFDSVLEADWAATLTRWGVEWRHHPGSLWTFGREWQPDFLLPGDERHGISDVVFEVKGPHDERLEKASDLARERHASVLVGRPGLVPPGSNAEQAGACWHNAVIGGHEFFVVWWDARLSFVTSEWIAETKYVGAVFASAERCLGDGRTQGLAMYKNDASMVR